MRNASTVGIVDARVKAQQVGEFQEAIERAPRVIKGVANREHHLAIRQQDPLEVETSGDKRGYEHREQTDLLPPTERPALRVKMHHREDRPERSNSNIRLLMGS